MSIHSQGISDILLYPGACYDIHHDVAWRSLHETAERADDPKRLRAVLKVLVSDGHYEYSYQIQINRLPPLPRTPQRNVVIIMQIKLVPPKSTYDAVFRRRFFKYGFSKHRNTRFGKPEPKDKCIQWKIQTAINKKACKRYDRGDSTHHNS